MRRRLSLILVLATCLTAVAPAAYATWRYSTQTLTGATTTSRSATGGCSVRTVLTAVRLSCPSLGTARATYTFHLPSDFVGRPAVSLVPALGPYVSKVTVVGSTATVTVRVTSGTYKLKWVNLVYYEG
jgi:hypothetical protein